MLEWPQMLHRKSSARGIQMKSNRSRSWIMIGGLAGLILGVVLHLTISGSEEEGGWKLQAYAAIAPSADRATELVGYNYQKELL
jgi:hypothetical protein